MMAVAAILLQVPDGVERPIVYASRLLILRRKHTQAESEMLDLVWATVVYHAPCRSKCFNLLRYFFRVLPCLPTPRGFVNFC